MESTQITINIPKKYLEAIELVINTFPIQTTVEEYLIECVRCGLEADVNDIFDYCELMQPERARM